MKALLYDALAEKGVKPEETHAVILGYAFLENSDDARNTPALPLYNVLKDELASVTIHDPYITEDEGLTMTQDLESAISGKDCVILVTKHREYLETELDYLKKHLKTPIIVDGRNVWDRKEAIVKGFTFRGIGLHR
jgi:UDP-N-acetyl-D-mannosaminuronic acid dehydrogenase